MRHKLVQPPVQPDAVLGAIVGTDPMPRTQITSRLWIYIKEHARTEGRNVRADDKLKALFDGADVVNMFELQKHITAHLVNG